ncbi:hypothetical protein [Nocardioides convexus]|uniref:hypothetical protein n=1 Tax=Nocardioides convexus TaxID=2712224 RepID=UPI00241845B8|nr:hypothetical protein [Nocardioides convexus]
MLATDDVDALLALRPDACCYNPLWPDVDELGRAAGERRQRVHQCRLDHRRQAVAGGPGADREGVRTGAVHDLRQRRPPRHDQPGRHGAQRVVRAGGRDPDHRVGGLLDVRVRADAAGDGLLAGPGDTRPRGDGTTRERGVRGVGRDDGGRARRTAGPDEPST